MSLDPALATLIMDFFAEARPEARRIFHGRGQCYPGLEHLCIDWYAPLVLITAWQPLADVKGLVAHILDSDPHGQVQTIMLQQRYLQGAPALCLAGSTPDTIIVREGPLQFEVQPGKRQNAGLFLDMRPLRQWLLANCEGANVLNLFAYTCSLSVAALAGGARRVTNVDVNKTSMRWGERNHRLNRQEPDRIRAIPHNVFTSWGRIQQFGRYERVIIDPPTRQKGSFDAERDYGAVLRKLPKLCQPGALVVAALNSPFLPLEFILDQCEKYLPGYTLREQLSPAPEFHEADPRRGLKICVLEMPANTA